MSTPKLDLTAAVKDAAKALKNLTSDGSHWGAWEEEAQAAIEAALPHLLKQIREGAAQAIDANAKELRDFGKRVGWTWTILNTAKDAGYGEAANIVRNYGGPK